MVNRVSEVLKKACSAWELPLDERMLAGMAAEILEPGQTNPQAHVAGVIARALYPREAMEARTLNGVLSALGGSPQRQGRFRNPGSAAGAANAEPIHRDIALWAMSVAFPSATKEQLVVMVDAAREVLRAPLQESHPPLQPDTSDAAVEDPGGRPPDPPPDRAP